MIRALAAALWCAAVFAAQLPAASAADTGQPSAAQQAQQDRMRSCNSAASDRTLKGDARNTFMSSCLAGKTDPNLMMKACNAQASQDKKTGDVRRSYMSACLKSPV
jgi:hypothetical protein